MGSSERGSATMLVRSVSLVAAGALGACGGTGDDAAQPDAASPRTLHFAPAIGDFGTLTVQADSLAYHSFCIVNDSSEPTPAFDDRISGGFLHELHNCPIAGLAPGQSCSGWVTVPTNAVAMLTGQLSLGAGLPSMPLSARFIGTTNLSARFDSLRPFCTGDCPPIVVGDPPVAEVARARYFGPAINDPVSISIVGRSADRFRIVDDQCSGRLPSQNFFSQFSVELLTDLPGYMRASAVVTAGANTAAFELVAGVKPSGVPANTCYWW